MTTYSPTWKEIDAVIAKYTQVDMAKRVLELERALAEERDHAMMAGQENSALRLQLRDAYADAAQARKAANSWKEELTWLKESVKQAVSPATRERAE